MKLTASRIRFLFEAAFIVLIAAAAALAQLDRLWIALSVGGAWALVALVERTALVQRGARRRGKLAFLFGGQTEDRGVTNEPATESPPAELPASNGDPGLVEHPPVPAPEPEPAPEPAPPAPDPYPPTPGPGEPPPPLLAVAPPPDEPEQSPMPESELEPDNVVAYLPRGDGEPREWNIWELERVARDGEGRDPARDEELGFLLLELRQFANAEGSLPVSFDPIVRESFGSLPSAAL